MIPVKIRSSQLGSKNKKDLSQHATSSDWLKVLFMTVRKHPSKVSIIKSLNFKDVL